MDDDDDEMDDDDEEFCNMSGSGVFYYKKK
jgi:hypothetical protein